MNAERDSIHYDKEVLETSKLDESHEHHLQEIVESVDMEMSNSQCFLIDMGKINEEQRMHLIVDNDTGKVYDMRDSR